jgi:hypothetical protein
MSPSLPKWAVESGWQSHPLPRRLCARLCPAPPLPADLEPLLAASWRKAQAARGGRLFDGRVFSVAHIDEEGLCGHFASYRAIIAQLDAPLLHARLGLRPLAVCGLIRSADGIVLGRRALHLGYQPGLWQLPPAGSVDTAGFEGEESDLTAHFWREVEEELGLVRADFTTLRPTALLEHPSHVLDLFFVAETPLGRAEIERRKEKNGNDEYDCLAIVDEQALPSWLAAHTAALAPQTRIFLALAGYPAC